MKHQTVTCTLGPSLVPSDLSFRGEGGRDEEATETFCGMKGSPHPTRQSLRGPLAIREGSGFTKKRRKKKMQAEGKRRMAWVNQHPVGGGCLETRLCGAADRRGGPQPRRRAKVKRTRAEKGGDHEL